MLNPEVNGTSTEQTINRDGVSKLKVMQFDPRTGTITPPSYSIGKLPAKKVVRSTRRGRPRSDKVQHNFLIMIPYGNDQSSRNVIGTRISSILGSMKLHVKDTTKRIVGKADKTQSLSRSADTKPKRKPAIRDSDILEMQGPVEIGPEAQMSPVSRSRKEAKAFARPSKATTLNFGKAGGRMLKQPGTTHAPWPTRDCMHVRGDAKQGVGNVTSSTSIEMIAKAKSRRVEVPQEENVLTQMCTQYRISELRASKSCSDSERVSTDSACLRIPTKHFIPGDTLRRLVWEELKTPAHALSVQDDPGDLEASRRLPYLHHSHPALRHLNHSLDTSLTAFDRFTCESQSWTQKYAPKSVDMLLSGGSSVAIMRDWLKSKILLSVDNGQASSTTKEQVHPVQRKRKRNKVKLDGFVVSSDDENEDAQMETLTESDDASNEALGVFQPTVSARKDGRRSNALLLSGPPGCGKSAAVYAVAHELGFEVFEIGPNSRRSGKDILEKVGDMTRNHQVQRAKTVHMSSRNDGDRSNDESATKEVQNGRQGTMKAFFKSASLDKQPLDSASPTTAPPSTTPQKKQKQSLILLEEVDLLYEDDKQFWATVMTLLKTSKRPIIMTCNDETTIPLHELSLHAIIRLKAPPTDLVTNYLLLLAANEGHVLKAEAVSALYESRKHDLRASITELNLWCQFAVGDRRAGLDWLEPRWPIGIDVDARGQTLRVVSEGTYRTGMGWLCRDSLVAESNATDLEDRISHALWDGWSKEIHDEHRISGQGTLSSRQSHRAHLAGFQNYSETLSLMDMCSGSAFVSDDIQMRYDTEAPALTDKARGDFPISHYLLDTPLVTEYHDLKLPLGLWLTAHARQALGRVCPFLDVQPLSEAWAISTIRKGDYGAMRRNMLRRRDFSIAFDPIALGSPSLTMSLSNYLDASVFDRPLSIVVEDAAPYVRSIIRYDQQLHDERIKLSGLLSEGTLGKSGKRMRTTRSALSALEGGARKVVRREKWFDEHLRPGDIERTSGLGWAEAAQTEAATRVVLSCDDEPTDRGEMEATLAGQCIV